MASGVPLLRHDWFPIVPSMRFAAILSGWDPTGVGAVIGYPASFLAIFARSAVASVLGSYATHLLFFAAYGLLVAFGAARLAAVLGAGAFARVAGALFAAFNPWAYTELVAGHGFMLLSYAAAFWLVAECCTHARSSLRLALLAIPLAPQVQFLLVCAPIYAWLALRMRSWVAFAAIASMLLPVAVGVLASRDVLVGIPITLEWEKGESLDPLRAVILRGYFTKYDTGLAPFYEWSLWVVVAIACVGVVTILVWRRRTAWLIAFATIPLVWSFGSVGPFANAFAWTITHVSEAGLFRELYDLLGFVAIGYVAFCAIAAARVRFLGPLWLATGLALLAGWTLAPPQSYWVVSRALPTTPIANEPNSRFLVLPALYPVRLARSAASSSGTDPDLYPRARNVDPVNEAQPMYPVSPAIARYLRDGSTEALGLLSVSHVVARPWLETDPSVRFQLALPLPDWLVSPQPQSATIDRVTPELSLGASPAIGTLVTNVGGGNVLFGDARDATGDAVPAAWHDFSAVRAVVPGNRFVFASDGWVDARLAFIEEPDIAQTYGGALTTNPTAVLPVVAGDDALVYVRGNLLASDGSSIAANTGGYRWVLVPPGARAVTCSGFCVVAAQAERVPDAPLNPPVQPAEGVPFEALQPWLVVATLPAGIEPLLRYDVTFDRKWTAFYDRAILGHVRVDGAFNGWFVPPRDRPIHVVLLETGAALTALAEVVSTLVLGSALFYAFRTRVAARAAPTKPSVMSESTI